MKFFSKSNIFKKKKSTNQRIIDNWTNPHIGEILYKYDPQLVKQLQQEIEILHNNGSKVRINVFHLISDKYDILNRYNTFELWSGYNMILKYLNDFSS